MRKFIQNLKLREKFSDSLKKNLKGTSEYQLNFVTYYSRIFFPTQEQVKNFEVENWNQVS
jgi:hypothetical protein